MSDYTKIAQAIDFIRQNVDRQPTLDDIAAQVHLSPYHFHRLFSRWAGVTPKRFLQVLTLERAKILLQKGNLSALDVTYSIGLSSGSRLYDHFVKIEAVTPSEYKQAGQGLTIFYGFHETPYGEAFVALTVRGVCKLCFVETKARFEPLKDLHQDWHNAKIIEDSIQTKLIVKRLFSRQPLDKTPLSLWVCGTNFQINVWKALLNIQPGQVTSYGEIAKAIAKPKAARAVGTAIGSNPVGLIIPCHRVIRQSGELGGYQWGETRKLAILAREIAINNSSW
ncbi:MAG TPA: bifunctional transcriptional activator/DNA repair enzyme AdaA [Xenococcaceae cyanobacterium]|jgi:AraC family transcriptional regulator of adaptative response/methylated-DNA-[protein]-cysteine methyltransferase